MQQFALLETIDVENKLTFYGYDPIILGRTVLGMQEYQNAMYHAPGWFARLKLEM